MMHCHQCNEHVSFEEAFTRMKTACHVIDIPIEYTLPYALNQHQAFTSNIKSLSDHRTLTFFKNDDERKKMLMQRPVLLHSLSEWHLNNTSVDLCHRQMISLVELKLNHIHQNYQMLLWIVSQPELTMMIDGTIYLLVHDVHYYTVRLVIRNWSCLVPINEPKSIESLNRLLKDLLPVDSLIILLDPYLTECSIDGQRTICCDAPNLRLILMERMKQCFVDESLEELRRRGNEAYSHGETQLAISYYSFAINRLSTIAQSLFSKQNDGEFNLFTNAFQGDLSRLYSNRSAAYLREGLYGSATVDSIIVSTAGLLDNDYDEYLIKCLYRLICANFGLNQLTLMVETFFKLSEKALEDYHYRQIYADDFHRLRVVLNRLKDEHERGIYDIKSMFSDDPFHQKTFFDLENFYANFQNKFYLKKRRGIYQAKCDIPAGSLILVQQPFVFVRTGNDEKYRLLNAVERHLNLSTSIREFGTLRQIPSIHRWLEDETDTDPNDFKTFPETIPYRILVKAQQECLFQSKQLIGWWPEASNFQSTKKSKEKENLFWFIAGKTLFICNHLLVKKNEELIISADQTFQFFENHRNLRLSIGTNRTICLNEFFEDLKRTQN